MPKDVCLDEISNAVNNKMTPKEVAALLDEIEAKVSKKQVKRDTIESLEESLFSTQAEMVGNQNEAVLLQKRNALLMAKAEANLLGKVKDYKTGAQALHAAIRGINDPIHGARLSVDARSKAIETKYLGGLVHDLEQGGVFDVFQSGSLDREIARELWEFRKNGMPGRTGVKQAQQIAEIVNKWQKVAVGRQNRAGAWIRSLQGYIVRQSHDMYKVRRAGFKEWAAFVGDKLDEDLTFKNNVSEEDRETFLKVVYDDLATGKNRKIDGDAESDLDLGIPLDQGANIAEKASQSRFLHFKDADSWFDYNQKFGSKNLGAAVLHGLDRAAQNTALMEAFGPKPRHTFEKVLTQLQDASREHPKAYDRLKGEQLLSEFAEIDGTTRIPVNRIGAQISSGLRAVQNMSKLGLVVLSSMADIPVFASEFKHQGVKLLSAYGRALENVLKGRRKGEARQIAELIGVGLDGMRGAVMSRFGANDDMPGRMSKLQQIFFKWSGLEWWTDAHQTGAGMMMGRYLAMNRKSTWKTLNPDLKRTLSLYGIDTKKWDHIRYLATKEADGNIYITPEVIQNMDQNELIKLFPGQSGVQLAWNTQRYKDDLETALRSYFIDRTDIAVIMPGVREAAIMRRGTKPGTMFGEAARFFFQFKSFPITFATKVVGRELKGKGRVDKAGLFHLIVGTTITGYLAMTAKDIAKGKTPRDITKHPGTVLQAAFLQGGGAGIYGDFLFKNYSRFGGGFLESTAGPTAGTMGDVMEVWSRLRDGDPAASQAFRLALNNTPFINMFYTRAAMDYLLFYHIQEAMNPGYLRRMERRMKKQQGQKFILPPSKVVN